MPTNEEVNWHPPEPWPSSGVSERGRGSRLCRLTLLEPHAHTPSDSPTHTHTRSNDTGFVYAMLDGLEALQLLSGQPWVQALALHDARNLSS